MDFLLVPGMSFRFILVTFSCYFDHPSIIETTWNVWNILKYKTVPQQNCSSSCTSAFSNVAPKVESSICFDSQLRSSMCQHLFATNNPELIFDLSVNFHRGNIRVFCPFCFIGVANAIQNMRYSIQYCIPPWFQNDKSIRRESHPTIFRGTKKRIVTKIPEASVSSSSWSSWSILDHKGQQCVNESQSRQG